MLRPFGKRLLVSVIKDEEESKVIIVPKQPQQEVKARILEIGDTDEHSHFLKKNDIVIVNTFAIRTIKYNDAEYSLVNISDIIAVDAN